MKAKCHNTNKRRIPFPLDALPEEFRSLCADQPQITALTALTILGGATGPSIRVRRPATPQSISGQLLLVIKSDDRHSARLSALLAPVKEFQRRTMADACVGEDVEALRKKEDQIRAQREQFFARDRFPEEAHLEHFNHQLRQVRLQGKRLFYADNPRPGTLLMTCQQSPDQGILVTWTDPRSFSSTLR